MKRYIGARRGDRRTVWLETEPYRWFELDPRFDLALHDATGFDWSNVSHGARQLALAILADSLDDSFRALDLHESFMHSVVSQLPSADWQLSLEEVLASIPKRG